MANRKRKRSPSRIPTSDSSPTPEAEENSITSSAHSGKSLSLKGDITQDATAITSLNDTTVTYGQTALDYIEKMTAGKLVFLPQSFIAPIFIGWILLISWLFVQDNGAGRLETLSGLYWFWAKFLSVGIFTLMIGIILLITWLINKFILWIKIRNQ